MKLILLTPRISYWELDFHPLEKLEKTNKSFPKLKPNLAQAKTALSTALIEKDHRAKVLMIVQMPNSYTNPSNQILIKPSRVLVESVYKILNITFGWNFLAFALIASFVHCALFQTISPYMDYWITGR